MRFSSTLFLAATILAAPVAGAFAQGQNLTGNAGSNRSATASPGTADSKAASGMYTGDAGSTTARSSHAARNPTVPGATGRTVVPGSGSTIANTAGNTRHTQTQGTASGGTK